MITVFGSINADLFFHVDQLPGRGETVLCPAFEIHTGGKGANQAVAAAAAGVKVRMFGAVGSDVFAGQVLGDMKDKCVDVSGFKRTEGKTGTAMVAVEASSENQIIVASGANLSVLADLVTEDALGPSTTLVLQMEVPTSETETIIRRARKQGCRIILNLAPAGDIAGDVLSLLDVLVVNEIEAGHLLGASIPGEEAANALADKYGCTVIVTLGSAGCVWQDADGLWQCPSLSIEPVDTVGAGDCFVGSLAAALDQGQGLSEAIRRASVAAGLACLEKGAQTAPDRETVNSRLSDLEEVRRVR